jgi:hypothetical protein
MPAEPMALTGRVSSLVVPNTAFGCAEMSAIRAR